jgi:casein kinase II subunit alpha
MVRGMKDSVARVYAEVNEKLGPDWYEYGVFSVCAEGRTRMEPLQITSRSSGVRRNSTRSCERLGGGSTRRCACVMMQPLSATHRYILQVFEGIDIANDERCVIKVLKPVKKKKIKREIKILQNLVGGTNVVALLDVVRDPVSKFPSLVTEYIENVDFKELYPRFDDFDVRYYMLELVKVWRSWVCQNGHRLTSHRRSTSVIRRGSCTATSSRIT